MADFIRVIDPSPVAQEGFVALLNYPLNRIKVVAKSGIYDEALLLCRQHRPDLLLLGVVTLETNTLQVLHMLRETCPEHD